MAYTSIDIPSPLNKCLIFCEVDCVIACCGIDAISTDPAHIEEWCDRVRPETVAEAWLQAVELMEIVKDPSHHVESTFLNHRVLDDAGRRELLDFLAAFESQLVRKV